MLILIQTKKISFQKIPYIDFGYLALFSIPQVNKLIQLQNQNIGVSRTFQAFANRNIAYKYSNKNVRKRRTI